MYTHMCVSLSLYMYVCIYMYIYIYIYIMHTYYIHTYVAAALREIMAASHAGSGDNFRTSTLEIDR